MKKNIFQLYNEDICILLETLILRNYSTEIQISTNSFFIFSVVSD